MENMKMIGLEQAELHNPESNEYGPQSEQFDSPASQIKFPQQLSFIELIHDPDTHVSMLQLKRIEDKCLR